MYRHAWLLTVILWAGLNPLRFAAAQEFRVYTKVYNAGGDARISDKPQLLVKSVTIFHAGKVYDRLDVIDEVTVIEPAHNRLTLLSKDRLLATTVDFDQIKHLMKVAKNETDKYIAELREKPGPETEKIVNVLQFHWNPEFNEQYDEQQKRLQLNSHYFRYKVLVKPIQEIEIVNAYLDFADMAARLNSVLHPRSLPPGPRIMLNQALRSRSLIPFEVELWADLESNLHLRAEHQFDWKLDDTDRRLIQHWDNLLKDPNVRYVTFAEYQSAVNTITQVPRPGKTR